MKLSTQTVLTIECDEDISCAGMLCSDCPIYRRTQSDKITLTADEAIKFIANNVLSLKMRPINGTRNEDEDVL